MREPPRSHDQQVVLLALWDAERESSIVPGADPASVRARTRNHTTFQFGIERTTRALRQLVEDGYAERFRHHRFFVYTATAWSQVWCTGYHRTTQETPG